MIVKFRFFFSLFTMKSLCNYEGTFGRELYLVDSQFSRLAYIFRISRSFNYKKKF